MKKWFISVVGLILVVALAAGVTFALAGNGNAASGHDRYELTVRFNTSVTQDDIDEVEALLRGYDDGLDFVIMEIFPPIGRAVLATDALDFCRTIEAQLEAKSYVDSVSCQVRQENGDTDPDVPVEHRNDMTD